MILHAEGEITRVTQPFDRPVVQVQMGDLHVVRERLRVDREPVVLTRDLDLSRGELLDRMVGTAVPELELVGGAAAVAGPVRVPVLALLRLRLDRPERRLFG